MAKYILMGDLSDNHKIEKKSLLLGGLWFFSCEKYFWKGISVANSLMFWDKKITTRKSPQIAYNMKGCARVSTFTFWILPNLAKHTYCHLGMQHHKTEKKERKALVCCYFSLPCACTFISLEADCNYQLHGNPQVVSSKKSCMGGGGGGGVGTYLYNLKFLWIVVIKLSSFF